MEEIELIIKLPEEVYEKIIEMEDPNHAISLLMILEVVNAIRNGKKNSETKDDVKDLLRRVENIERQMREECWCNAESGMVITKKYKQCKFYELKGEPKKHE